MATIDPYDDMPAADQNIIDADQPETQGVDPLEAELGESGEGDLAPEDELVADADAEGDEPQDLRTEL